MADKPIKPLTAVAAPADSLAQALKPTPEVPTFMRNKTSQDLALPGGILKPGEAIKYDMIIYTTLYQFLELE
jgi:hypothetical protein